MPRNTRKMRCPLFPKPSPIWMNYIFCFPLPSPGSPSFVVLTPFLLRRLFGKVVQTLPPPFKKSPPAVILFSISTIFLLEY